jgi:hypothetical protein
MVNKTLITNSTLVEIMKNIFTENDFDIAIQGVNNKKAFMTKALEYLDINFYCFQADQTVRGFYGMTSDQQEQYIKEMSINMQKTMALCEVSNLEVLASEDIDGGSYDGTITFFIQTDKIALLDDYITRLRNRYTGEYESGINSNGDETAIMMKIGDLVVQDSPFTSPIGRANICSLTINFGYMLKALNYTSEKFLFSLTGEMDSYKTIPFSNATLGITYTTLPNTCQNQPMVVGDISNSASMSITVTYYEFSKFEILSTLRQRVMKLCSEDNKINPSENLRNSIYVRYQCNGDVYTYRMIVKEYIKKIINTDFSATTITLAIDALAED